MERDSSALLYLKREAAPLVTVAMWPLYAALKACARAPPRTATLPTASGRHQDAAGWLKKTGARF